MCLTTSLKIGGKLTKPQTPDHPAACRLSAIRLCVVSPCRRVLAGHSALLVPSNVWPAGGFEKNRPLPDFYYSMPRLAGVDQEPGVGGTSSLQPCVKKETCGCVSPTATAKDGGVPCFLCPLRRRHTEYWIPRNYCVTSFTSYLWLHNIFNNITFSHRLIFKCYSFESLRILMVYVTVCGTVTSLECKFCDSRDLLPSCFVHCAILST